jgi:TolB-like protein
MKKLLVVLSLLICSCSTTSNYYSFDNALEMGTEKIQNDLPAGAEVAILDFKSENENLSAYVIEEMYDKLINFGKLSIMERSRTNTIAMEIGYQFSGEVDDNEIIAIGHQLGADYVVTGQIIYSGEAYRLRVFAIDIAKGRRVASSSLNINPNDRQITYLLTTKTVDRKSVVKTTPQAAPQPAYLGVKIRFTSSEYWDWYWENLERLPENFPIHNVEIIPFSYRYTRGRSGYYNGKFEDVFLDDFLNILIGAYINKENARYVGEILKNAGFESSYQIDSHYKPGSDIIRVLIIKVKSNEIQEYAIRLGNLGFKEIGITSYE